MNKRDKNPTKFFFTEPYVAVTSREESRDESIAWRHLFTFDGNNDDKSETI